MSKENVVTAIDVGSDKIATLIGVYADDTLLRVVGSAVAPSQGVIKGAIVDLESALGSVEASLNAAERMAGFSVKSAFISISGNHIQSHNSTGVVAVADPDQEITSSDVERVIEAARAISVPADREVIHVIPRYYKVDSQAGVRDPTGMSGVRLEAEAHIISASSTYLRNISKCLNDLGITVQGFVFAALAASEVVLTETEKELGIVVCDIGADTSTFCAYVDGAIEFSGALPIGARHISKDVALGCRLDLDVAEKIKLYLNEVGLERVKPLPNESKKDLAKRKKEADIINLDRIGVTGVAEELSRSFVITGVMYPRIQEIVCQLGQALEKEKLFERVPAGVVFTGGGALSLDLEEIAQRVLGLPIRLGKPEAFDGLIAESQLSSYAVGVGLLNYAKKYGEAETTSSKLNLKEVFKDLKINQLGKKAVKLVKNILP